MRRAWAWGAAAVISVSAAAWAAVAPPAPADAWPSTFSIVASDPASGDLGVAVQSRFLAVGGVVPWAKAGVGALATQSYANTTYGPRGLALLEKGVAPAEVVRRLTQADAERATRQLGIVDARGRMASYTGADCNAWAGDMSGPHHTCQGNILAGPQVVSGMSRAFLATEGPLAERLLAALDAGQAAGGDRRGQQSAALLVVRAGGGYAGFNDRYIDLRVDDHPEPIRELRRVYEQWKRIFGRSAAAAALGRPS